MTRLSRLPAHLRSQVEKPLSSLESAFLLAWKAFATYLPEPIMDKVCPIPGRRYRLDAAWPSYRIAVELDGTGGGGYGRTVRCHACGATVRAVDGQGHPGRVLKVPYPSHGSGGQISRDAEKFNLLQIHGWKVLRFTPKMMEDPEKCVRQVIELMEKPAAGREKMG